MAVTLLVGRIAQQSCTVQDREHSAGRRNLQPLLRRKSGRKEKSGGAFSRHASLSCPSSALDCAFSAAQQVDGKDKSGHCSSVFFFFSDFQTGFNDETVRSYGVFSEMKIPV